MHFHLPTDTALLIASPAIGVGAAFIFLLIFNFIQNRSNIAWLWQIFGVIFIFASLIIGIAIPFFKK